MWTKCDRQGGTKQGCLIKVPSVSTVKDGPARIRFPDICVSISMWIASFPFDVQTTSPSFSLAQYGIYTSTARVDVHFKNYGCLVVEGSWGWMRGLCFMNEAELSLDKCTLGSSWQSPSDRATRQFPRVILTPLLSPHHHWTYWRRHLVALPR